MWVRFSAQFGQMLTELPISVYILGVGTLFFTQRLKSIEKSIAIMEIYKLNIFLML
jgi:hypothetical protein